MEIISETAPAQPVARKPQTAGNGLNLKSIVALLISKWYWFVISLAITVSLGVVQIMRTTPLYTRSASILIRDDSKGGNSSTSVDMSELGISTSSVNLDNEIRTLKSPSLMKEVVDRLDLNDVYSITEGLRDNQLYKRSPVVFSSADSVDNFSVTFKYRLGADNKVEISQINVNGQDIDGVVKTAVGDTATPLSQSIFPPCRAMSVHISTLPRIPPGRWCLPFLDYAKEKSTHLWKRPPHCSRLR